MKRDILDQLKYTIETYTNGKQICEYIFLYKEKLEII